MRIKLSFLVLTLLMSNLTFGQKESIIITETIVKIKSKKSEELFFGFKEGDQIIFNYELIKGKSLKEIEFIEYPNNSLYMDYKSSKISNKILNINSTGIYKFVFKNNAIGTRICKIKIERIPKSIENINFNTSVYWKTFRDTTFYTVQKKYLIKTEYIPRTIIPTTEYFVNSGSNASLKGGRSRITFPVIIPQNTIEWYYQFSTSRNKSEVNQIKRTFNLAEQLSNLIDVSGALSFGVEALTKPPGANYCDIYQLNYQDSRLFEAKNPFRYNTTGSRQNIKSGIIKMQNGANQTFYIGILNPDPIYGIHIAIEVVAIVAKKTWGTKNIRKYKVKKTEKPFIKE